MVATAGVAAPVPVPVGEVVVVAALLPLPEGERVGCAAAGGVAGGEGEGGVLESWRGRRRA